MKLPSKPDSCQSRTSGSWVPIPSHFPMPGRWWGGGKMGEAEIHKDCQFLFQPRAPASPPPSPPASRPQPTSRRTRGPADPGVWGRRHLAPGLGPAGAGRARRPDQWASVLFFLKSASRGMLDLAGRAL